MTMRALARRLLFVLIFSVPVEAVFVLSAFGTLTKLLGMIVGTIWVLSALAGARVRPLDRFHVVAFAFVLWNGFSVFWSIDPGPSATGFLTLVQLLGFTIVMWDLLDHPRVVASALQAYVLGAFLSIGGVTFNFVTGQSASWRRYSGSGFNVDYLSLVIALGIPVAWFLAYGVSRETTSRAMRFANIAYVVAAPFAMVLTGTRGAVVASIPTALFILWSLGATTRVQRVIGVVVAAAAIVLVFNYAPQASLDRIATTPSEVSAGGGVGGRLETWEQSLDAFAHRPLTGVGINAHRAAVDSGRVAHNIFISVLTETGIVGAVLFASLLVRVHLWVRRRSGWPSRFWMTQIAVVLIGGMTLSIEDSKAVWLFLALAVIDASVAEGADSGPHPASTERPRPHDRTAPR